MTRLSRYGLFLCGLALPCAFAALLVLLAPLSARASVGFGGSTAIQATQPHGPADCGGSFQVVSSPNVPPTHGGDRNHLLAVSALAANDVWAVGYVDNTAALLIEHWDGVQWSVTPAPSQVEGDAEAHLYDVLALAHDDVWAVGFYLNSTLTLHWDGTRWNYIDSPSPDVSSSGGPDVLTSISALAPDDIWAVGYFAPVQNGRQTLALHWDGYAWSVVPTGDVPSPDLDQLNSVSAVAPNDVWAVGAYYPAGDPQNLRTLIQHWDGNQWSTLSGADAVISHVALNAVSAVSSSDVWAVGNYVDPPNGNYMHAAIMHWDGNGWNLVQAPSTLYVDSILHNVLALSTGDVWAVGNTYDPSVSAATSLAIHWNGSTWSTVSSGTPAQGSTPGYYGVSAAYANDVWAVGDYYNNANYQGSTLTEHFSDPCSTAPTPTYTPTATATPTCQAAFAFVASQNPQGSNSNLFQAIKAVSANDIWAAGLTYTPTNNYSMDLYDLFEHWNGSQWQVVSSTNSLNDTRAIFGLDAVANNDVWAVGEFNYGATADQMLIEHWNGTAWSQSSTTAPPGSYYQDLYAVDAFTSTDVWAVGSFNDDEQSLVMHWNGVAWVSVPSPNPANATKVRLTGVSAVSAIDVWAVGWYADGNGYHRTVTMHWNGAAWSIVASPNSDRLGNDLRSVGAIASNDVWAVGYGQGDYHGYYHPLALHWDGSAWTIVATPNIGSGVQFLSVVTLAHDNVWAAGSQDSFSHTMSVMHWNGLKWVIVPVATPPGAYGQGLAGITAISDHELWVAGSYSTSPNANYPFGYSTFTEHYLNQCPAEVVPTRTPTRTPTNSPTRTPTNTRTNIPTNTATNTAMLAPSATSTVAGSNSTSTPKASSTPTSASTAAPTACDIQFTDVPSSSPFYNYIRCLACRNVLSGYNDEAHCGAGNAPCFQPNANITRGQAAKIVANAAGYNDSVSANAQSFADVPSSNPFWLFIERVYKHGAISGSPCSGKNGEPSSGACYRPGDNLTRGQLAKIASNAAGFSEAASGQSFNDVPNTSPFYVYIERAHLHNIISGYACGGPGEPCPGPYFRPSNNVTRGQAAKIISGTFFPNCQTPAKP